MGIHWHAAPKLSSRQVKLFRERLSQIAGHLKDQFDLCCIKYLANRWVYNHEGKPLFVLKGMLMHRAGSVSLIDK